MMIRSLILAGVILLGGTISTVHAGQGNANAYGGSHQGLAVGQNPKLLQTTRDTNAGAGNGSEFYRTCSFTGRAHNMCLIEDRDPGNSQWHNQSPECDVIYCEFDPRG